MVLQVTNKNMLLETNTQAIQEIPGGKIEVRGLQKKKEKEKGDRNELGNRGPQKLIRL